MKRYRVTNSTFDFRVNTLTQEIKEGWDESVKLQWIENAKKIRLSLVQQYGVKNYQQKEKNFIEMGSAFFSVIAFHNDFLSQIRNSFVISAYYPALTGAATLTERILNHLIITLRDEYKNTDEYKEVYDKNSCTDWDKMIRILYAWKVLLPETEEYLKKLQEYRHQRAAHFNPETDDRAREFALEALRALQEFVKIQFGAFGTQPWIIPNTMGEFFIKKEYETHPFVAAIYLPNSVYVGPEYSFDTSDGTQTVRDSEYEDIEITDDEFVRLREGFQNR